MVVRILHRVFSMRTQGNDGDGPQSVRRATNVLFAFTLERPTMSVSQVADAAGVNRSTAYRLLAALESSGLVRRDAITSQYSLGPRTLRLAEVYLQQLADIRAVAVTPLTQLRDDTQETAALHVREEFARVTVAQVESRHQVRRSYPDMGERLSLHRGAPSVAILAFLGPDEQERYFKEAPSQWSDFANVNVDELRRQLADTKRVGYALSDQQRTPGVISVAAPIFDRSGGVVGAVNLSGPVQRISRAQAEAFAPLVMRAAHRISSDLGYEPRPSVQQPLAGKSADGPRSEQ
jgi:DNA-binding IclR family transcriptional regulator